MSLKHFAMKNTTLTMIFSVLCLTTLLAQEAVLKNLTPFDKIVINGDVQEVRMRAAGDENPVVKIKGVADSDVTAGVEAGTLHLTMKGAEPAVVTIYNSRLKRISGAADMKITGAEVIGGESGNYLVVSFRPSHETLAAWAADDENFHVHIPDLHVDVPDMDFALSLPEVDFDFDFDFDDHNFDFRMDIGEDFDENWRHEWRYNWEDHKEEIRRWSEEYSEEMKEVMKEAKEELKRMKKEHKH